MYWHASCSAAIVNRHGIVPVMYMAERSLHDRYSIGRFHERLNRFVMVVETGDGSLVEAFCPNTSRLIGLLEGTPEVLLTHNEDPARKTAYTVRAIRDNDHWVGIDAARANDIFEAHLTEPATGPFAEWRHWEREVTHDESQFDFCRTVNDRREWVEVKSLSSRTSQGNAFYSGTPSKRGYRHLEHLGDLAEAGDDAWCVFVIQRLDVQAVVPAEVTQPQWIQSLRAANDRGVEILAYRCRFDGNDWRIDARIPARL